MKRNSGLYTLYTIGFANNYKKKIVIYDNYVEKKIEHNRYKVINFLNKRGCLFIIKPKVIKMLRDFFFKLLFVLFIFRLLTLDLNNFLTLDFSLNLKNNLPPWF